MIGRSEKYRWDLLPPQYQKQHGYPDWWIAILQGNRPRDYRGNWPDDIAARVDAYLATLTCGSATKDGGADGDLMVEGVEEMFEEMTSKVRPFWI